MCISQSRNSVQGVKLGQDTPEEELREVIIFKFYLS